MNNIRQAGRRLVAVAFAVGLCAATAPAARADGPAPTKQQARFEADFLKGMIDHHAMAVEMAMLCEDRAVHDDLIDLCDRIIADQTAEIETMQGWLEDWYGIEYEPRMTRQMERQIEKMAGLDGAEFEVAFLEMMIRHHRAAIREGERCIDRAYHEDLVEMCEDIVEAQTAEIALMRGWLSEWY